MKKLPGQKTVNPLGQIRDEVLDAGKGIVKDVASTVAHQPKDILDSILGKPASSDQKDGGLEDTPAAGSGGGHTGDPQNPQANKMQMIMQKKREEQEKIKLHRARLQEEIQYYQRRKQEEEQEEKQEEVESERKKAQIEQVKREKLKEQRQRQIAGRQGSKELGRGKKF